MASQSAPSTPSPSVRYFCHKCVREVDNINEDAFTCPYCNQGFLEKLPDRGQEPHEHDDDDDDGANPAAVDFNEFMRNIALPMLFPNAAQLARAAGPGRQQGTANPAGATGQQQQPPNPFQGFLQNLLEGLAGAGGGGGGGFQVQVQFNAEDGQPHFFGFPPLHGNPGDYAWGPGGLDEIVTRLLNQFEGGAPPLTEEQIKNLPHVEISQEQVEKRLQCTVCMEDFKLAENVRRLPCGHHFHDACIVPWLTRHDTCPVCRKQAANTENRTQPPDNSSGRPGGASGSSGGNTGTRPGTQQGNTGRQPAWDVIEELD